MQKTSNKKTANKPILIFCIGFPVTLLLFEFFVDLKLQTTLYQKILVSVWVPSFIIYFTCKDAILKFLTDGQEANAKYNGHHVSDPYNEEIQLNMNSKDCFDKCKKILDSKFIVADLKINSTDDEIVAYIKNPSVPPRSFLREILTIKILELQNSTVSVNIKSKTKHEFSPIYDLGRNYTNVRQFVESLEADE